MDAFLDYILSGLSMTLLVLCYLLGPLCLLGLSLHFLSNSLRHQCVRLAGKDVYIWLTALGTVVHELSHAIMCVIFFHKITEMKLFSPASDGTLGYVKHTYNRHNIYQRCGDFFIATAPLWLGSLVIYGLAKWLLADTVLGPVSQVNLSASEITSWSGLKTIPGKMLPAILSSAQALIPSMIDRPWHFAGFIYAALTIASHVTLSPPDLKGAASGLVACVLLLFAVNLCTLWMGDFMIDSSLAVVRASIVLYLVLLCTMLLVGGMTLVLLLLNKLLRRK